MEIKKLTVGHWVALNNEEYHKIRKINYEHKVVLFENSLIPRLESEISGIPLTNDLLEKIGFTHIPIEIRLYNTTSQNSWGMYKVKFGDSESYKVTINEYNGSFHIQMRDNYNFLEQWVKTLDELQRVFAAMDLDLEISYLSK